MVGDHTLEPASALELGDQAQIGLAEPLRAVRARLDDLADVHHLLGRFVQSPLCGGGEQGHPEPRLGLLDEPGLTAEHVGA